MDDKIKAHYNAFIKHYDDIFWPHMDITKEAVDEILGVDSIDGIKSVRPLNTYREMKLKDYIVMRTVVEKFVDPDGKYFLMVNKRLARLHKGQGFGELALMSSVRRMASVRTTKDSCLATLTRREFLVVMRRF